MFSGSFSFILNIDYTTSSLGMTLMNHLVFLDPQAGELEKILSGIKTMVLKEYVPSRSNATPVGPGDCLYFLRNQGPYAVRVKAAVIRVLPFINSKDEDLSHLLKEMQPKLQLTEDQYNYWSAKKNVLLVEFEAAAKTGVIFIPASKIPDRSSWIAFEELSQIM